MVYELRGLMLFHASIPAVIPLQVRSKLVRCSFRFGLLYLVVSSQLVIYILRIRHRSGLNVAWDVRGDGSGYMHALRMVGAYMESSPATLLFVSSLRLRPVVMVARRG